MLAEIDPARSKILLRYRWLLLRDTLLRVRDWLSPCRRASTISCS